MGALGFVRVVVVLAPCTFSVPVLTTLSDGWHTPFFTGQVLS